jgi:hypothetical protein
MAASPALTVFWQTPAAAGLIAAVVGASLNQALGWFVERFKARSARQARREEKHHDRLLSSAEACYEALAGLVDDVGQLTAFLKSANTDPAAERRAVVERFRAFNLAHQRVTVYVSSAIRKRLATIRDKVVSIVNRHDLTRSPGLNSPSLWEKIGADYEELIQLREALAEAFYQMLV